MTSEQQPSTPAPKTRRPWDALQVFYRECAAYSLVPQILQPYLTNSQLTAKIGDLDQLVRLSQLLAKDVSDYSQRLSRIYMQHQNRYGVATGPNDLMQAFQIQEQYVAWGTSYESVVMPTVAEIVDIYAKIGVDTSPMQFPSPVTVLEPPAAIEAEQNSKEA